jgi:tetratricopeptide (TPR) repeat protein
MLNAVETLGYTEQEKNYLYNSAAQKCQIGDFKGALAIFQFLSMLDTQNHVYIKAIAGCMHGLEDYGNAISYYKYTYDNSQERGNYDCLFYIARCHLKLNDYLVAKINLSKFIELCENDKIAHDAYDKLIKKSHVLLKSINNIETHGTNESNLNKEIN